MTNQDIIKLIKRIEKQVISILLVRGYINRIDNKGDYSFKNSELTEKSKKFLKVLTPEVKDDFVKKYRTIFPKGRQGSPKTVKLKMEKYMYECECSEEDIINAAKAYVKTVKDKDFCTSADYFLYKQIKGEGTVSKIDEWMEHIKQQETNSEKDWRDELGN